MSILIHINACPGVGKLTIARELAPMLGARVIDNHAIYNVAFALTEFKSEAFHAAVRAVRTVAFDCILALPAGVPVILTNAHFTDGGFGPENWQAVRELADRRGLPLAVVILDCSAEENRRRIEDPSRIGKGALRDPEAVAGLQARQLIDHGGDFTLRLDVTELAAASAARRIADWLAGQGAAAAGAQPRQLPG